MPLGSSQFAASLRQELHARNEAFASSKSLSHVLSYGEAPVIVYSPELNGRAHGNFLDSSYAEILKQPGWSCRLEKVHTSGRKSLPRTERAWKELDSSMSSDALLMNIFCFPKVCRHSGVSSILGTEPADAPEFGYKARVPLLNGRTDRTEVDMKLGRLFVEAKLTESDFQMKDASVVESYRDLHEVFNVAALPRRGGKHVSYQLIRNVLAAHASEASFCVIADARRPDLIEAWYAVMCCVRHAELRTRCKVLTWQELSVALPRKLQKFLEAKYGITSLTNRTAHQTPQED
jgi:restriction endonuclease-like protein